MVYPAPADAGHERMVVAGLATPASNGPATRPARVANFGLACPYLRPLHLPIHRYADLVVHPAVHAVLGGDPAAWPGADELRR